MSTPRPLDAALMLLEVAGFSFALALFAPGSWPMLGNGLAGLLGGWVVYAVAALLLTAGLRPFLLPIPGVGVANMSQPCAPSLLPFTPPHPRG